MQTRIVPGAPALLMENGGRTLVVADLHIGFDSMMASGGVFVGKNSAISQTIREVAGLVKAHGCDSLVLLGDVKSSIRGIAGAEWDEVPRFLSEIGSMCDITIVPGNHDAGIERLVPDGVSVAAPAGLLDGGVLLTHGHAMPPPSYSRAEKILMGHLHPVFLEEGSVLSGQRVWVSIMAERSEIFPGRPGRMEVIVMPAFNRYLYATHRVRRARPASPITGRISTVHAARITTLDGVIIGDESALGRVI